MALISCKRNGCRSWRRHGGSTSRWSHGVFPIAAASQRAQPPLRAGDEGEEDDLTDGEEEEPAALAGILPAGGARAARRPPRGHARGRRARARVEEGGAATAAVAAHLDAVVALLAVLGSGERLRTDLQVEQVP